MADRIQTIQCECESPDHHGAEDAGTVYYTTILNHNRTRVIYGAGPFETHREAAAKVDALRRWAGQTLKDDVNLPWYAYGTSGRPRALAIASRNLV